MSGHEAIRSPILEVATLAMAAFSHLWFFAGGWALDMDLGRMTRRHDDVDITVFREHLPSLLCAFDGWDRRVAVPGEGLLLPFLSPEDARSPRHELHFQKEETQLEFLLVDREGDVVPFRRDPAIRIPLSSLVRQDPAGRPYEAPEWQFLFKARLSRPKDDQDFLIHLPHLPKLSRDWLRAALEVHTPDHWWIDRLRDGASSRSGPFPKRSRSQSPGR